MSFPGFALERNGTMTMNRTSKVSWGRWLLVILVLLSALAAKKEKQARAKATEAAPPPALTIQEIQATADQVTIQGSGPLLKATPFILGDPIRLMIDFKAATVAANVPASIPVGGDPIQTVQVTTLPGSSVMPSTVRLQLNLAKDVNYQLQPSGNTLVIVLTPRLFKTQETIPEEVYKQAKKVEESLYSTGQYTPPPSGIEMPRAQDRSQPGASTPVAPELAAPGPGITELQPLPPAPPPVEPAVRGTASQVVDILYRSGDRGFQILIKTNGGVGNYSLFTLDQPNRLVVDLPGLQSAAPKSTFPLGQPGIQRVRVGAHPNKTRVVIDFSGPIPAYALSRARQGLIVTLTLP
jgi:type IV pilus assembly protein PilQ